MHPPIISVRGETCPAQHSVTVGAQILLSFNRLGQLIPKRSKKHVALILQPRNIPAFGAIGCDVETVEHAGAVGCSVETAGHIEVIGEWVIAKHSLDAIQGAPDIIDCAVSSLKSSDQYR